METTQRGKFVRNTGAGDGQCFITIHPPNQPVTISDEMSLATNGVSITEVFEEGHTYQLTAEREMDVVDWWYGTRNEVMASRWAKEHGLLPPSGKPVMLSVAEPVDLEAVQKDTSPEGWGAEPEGSPRCAVS